MSTGLFHTYVLLSAVLPQYMDSINAFNVYLIQVCFSATLCPAPVDAPFLLHAVACLFHAGLASAALCSATHVCICGSVDAFICLPPSCQPCHCISTFLHALGCMSTCPSLRQLLSLRWCIHLLAVLAVCPFLTRYFLLTCGNDNLYLCALLSNKHSSEGQVGDVR